MESYFKNNTRTISSLVAMILIITNILIGCQHEEGIDIYSDNSEKILLKSQTLSPDEFEYFGEIIKCQDNEKIWEKQLSLVMADKRSKSNSLILNNYRFLSSINSTAELEIIKQDIIRDAVFPVYSSQDCFEICKKLMFRTSL